MSRIVSATALALAFAVPTNPQEVEYVGSYGTPGEATSVFVSASSAFVADGDSGLQIIDVSDPANPTLSATFPGTSTKEVFVAGNYAYISNSAGLMILDVSDPTEPMLIGQHNRRGDIFVLDDYVYLAAGRYLRVVDVSVPSDPTLVGEYALPPGDLAHGFQVNGIHVSGNYAYMGIMEWFNGCVPWMITSLGVFDISNPSAPVLVGSYGETSTPVHALFISGSHAYFAVGGVVGYTTYYGLWIVDVTDPASPALATKYDTYTSPLDVYVAGGYAYIANNSDGLAILDISDPSNPVLAGSYDTPNAATGVFVSEPHIYVADRDSLIILRFGQATDLDDPEVSLPEQLNLLQNYPNPFNARTTIRYQLPEPADIVLEIYNLVGQRVATLYEGKGEAGQHSLTWDANDLPSGVYLARLQTPERSETLKMVLLK